MRTTSSFTILFWIHGHRADKNNLSPIYARITIGGQKVVMGVNQKVDINSWDPQRQKAKGSNPTSKSINAYLDELRAELIFCYRELKSEHRQVTPQLLKARYLGEDKKTKSLRDIIAFHNEKMASKLCAKTLCHFKTSQNYLVAYLEREYKRKDIGLDELDYAFVLGFEHFLRGYRPDHYQGSIGNNTVMKHIQRLRKMVTLAYHMEWIARDPFTKFKPKVEKKEREFLTAEELKSIEDMHTPIERIETVKDLFIFSCYTGISYGDIMDLTVASIVIGMDGRKWIMSKRNKTGTPFKIPLLSVAEGLIEKYKNHDRTRYSDRLLPKLSNQKLNGYLKEIADRCAIHKNLTFHMARHTFATTVTLSNGVPIETVSKLLGHTKMATTQIYAKVIERKVSEDMEKLRAKLG